MSSAKDGTAKKRGGAKKDRTGKAPKKIPAKKLKIPKAYSKPLREKKYRSLEKMLSDRTEKQMLEKSFPADSDGRRSYRRPESDTDALRIAEMLKKVRKARSGPRTIRIVIVALIVIIPVIFNIFFLDALAARYLERGLESIARTDVGVRGLDIMILRGRVALDELAFASPDDPMIDEWVVKGMEIDVETSSLLYRRLVMQDLKAGVEYGVGRKTAAVYPEGADTDRRAVESPEQFDSVSFDWIPAEDLPTDSVRLAEDLRRDAEAVYGEWSANLESDSKAVMNLIDRTEDFVSEPLPDAKNVSAWAGRLNEGRNLAGEFGDQSRLIGEYRTELLDSRREVAEARARVAAAVEADLARIESAMELDSDLVNRWVEAALRAYAGPRIASLAERALEIRSRIEETRNSGKGGSARSGNGRMKSGRIVSFPVNMPPRFSIENLDIGGEGYQVAGSDVGVDHDLVGAPSVVEFVMDGAYGVSGSLEAGLTVDGRTGADPSAAALFGASGWGWSVDTGDSGVLGGIISVEGDITVPAGEKNGFISEGQARLTDWKPGPDMGEWSFIGEDTPPMEFSYEMEYSDGKMELGLSLEPASLRAWGGMIADVFLTEGTRRAREALMDSVDADLSGLDALIGEWDGSLEDVAGLEGLLGGTEKELKDMLEDMAGEAAGGISLDEPESVIGGLKSFF